MDAGETTQYYVGIHYSKYRMPIHYDTIEDWKNKKQKQNKTN